MYVLQQLILDTFEVFIAETMYNMLINQLHSNILSLTLYYHTILYKGKYHWLALSGTWLTAIPTDITVDDLEVHITKTSFNFRCFNCADSAVYRC